MANNGYIKSVSADPSQFPLVYGANLGRVAGHTRIFAGGHTPTPAANTDVWEGAGLYPFQTSATKLEILSASANDTAAGTGARTVTLQGLDANFATQSEVLTMNGVTPVQTVNSYLRVNDLRVTTAGSGGQNAGDITLRVTGGGATQGIMRALYGYAKTAIYTVPAGFTLLVTGLLFGVGGVGTATSVVFSFTRVTPAGVITTTNEYNASPATPIQREPIEGAVVSAMNTLTTRITIVNAAPSGAYASFEGVLIDNSQLA